MLQVQCKTCGTQAFTENNADPDSALTCAEGSGCCAVDHHHGQAANETGTACRPVTITLIPGALTMHRAAGL